MTKIRAKDLKIPSRIKSKITIPYDPYQVMSTHHYVSSVTSPSTEEKIIGIYSQNQDDIRKYLQETTFLARSSESSVFKSRVALTDGSVAVKESDSDSAVHEVVVGVKAINYLRDFIPTFAKVYGYVSCGKWIEGKDKKIEWCNYPDPETNYVFYEIINGQSFADFLSVRRSHTTLLKIILGVCYSLKIAREIFEFTHYDLHDRNLMIITLPEEVEVDYFYTKIQTKYIPIIIDYDFSHVKVDGVNYGVEMNKYHVKNSVGSEMIDIFKLLGTSADACLFENNLNNYYFFEDAFGYLSDDLYKIIETSPNHLFYPPENSFKSLTFDGYLEYLKNTFEEEMDKINDISPNLKSWRDVIFQEKKMIATNMIDVSLFKESGNKSLLHVENQKDFPDIVNSDLGTVSEKISSLNNDIKKFQRRRKKDKRSDRMFLNNAVADYYYLKRVVPLFLNDDMNHDLEKIKIDLKNILYYFRDSPSILRKFRVTKL